MLIFWTFAFPIILGTFFNMAFRDIENNEKLDIIDIAIVTNEYYESNKMIGEAFKNLSNPDSQEYLFDIEYVSLEEAKELILDDEISGYILFSDNPDVVVLKNGINETVLTTVVNEIYEKSQLIETIATAEIKKELLTSKGNIDYEDIYNKVVSLVTENTANIKDVSSKKLSYTMIEYYTLIAMTCLYGGILGMVSINKGLANMSSTGKRITIAPTKKIVTVISSALSAFISQIIGVALLFLYTIFVLKVDYGTNMFLVLLLTAVGSFAGLSLGILVSSLFKTNEDTKTGIIISITMLGCFFSGMMGITMKYVIDKNIPIINKLNPANMITDGFYALYYYDTLERYYFNLISLFIFAIMCLVLATLSLRRQKYDSI